MPDIERKPSDLPLPFSKAVQAGGFVFLSGQIALSRDGAPVHGPIEEQTRNVLDRIAETLAQLGSGLADVVRVTEWLSDLTLFAQFNDVYRDYSRRPICLRGRLSGYSWRLTSMSRSTSRRTGRDRFYFLACLITRSDAGAAGGALAA